MSEGAVAYALERLPETDEELWWLVKVVWGFEIPRVAVCPGHVSPFTAFAQAYFARSENIVWIASRGLGGKSTLLALLGLTIVTTYGVGCSIIGGSAQQTERVHEAMRQAWEAPNAPRSLIRGDLTITRTRLTNGGSIVALSASSNSLRGPHPVYCLNDEVDLFDIDLLNAAMGQPMSAKGHPPVSVYSSTWHLPDGGVSYLRSRMDDPQDPFGAAPEHPDHSVFWAEW